MADEFDSQKDEIFRRWQASGVAPSALNCLWELARIVRENDDHMDTIGEAESQVERQVAWQAFWNSRGIHYSAVSYLADQRALRAVNLQINDLRMGEMTASDPKNIAIVSWMDGLATGVGFKAFDFTSFFPPIDGSLAPRRK